MIKYLLKCNNKHEFESWFSDSKEFEKLKKKNLIECIFCYSKNIQKSIMSPNIASKEKNIEKKFNNEEFDKIKRELIKIRKFVEKNFEFVGDKFPKEARDIYYDNKKNKNIYGTATPEEKLELEEEGIELASIPWVNNKKEN
ncbi:DUF1178 family protein [Pelagibacteraceae bacterium]|nr:DUF1178 family protein [Pelagibacteraceae bacterium]|tara:strand:- start:205 stop:630 length:426 start_codon:yes stop_codon:yes gene_type:complete